LVFLSRNEHDDLLSQIEILQLQVADKQRILDDVAQGGSDTKFHDDKTGSFLASIEKEIEQKRIAEEKELLEQENHRLSTALEEGEVKSRALKSEMIKLRTQIQQLQQQKQHFGQQLRGSSVSSEASANVDGAKMEITRLGEENLRLKAGNTQLKSRLADAEKKLTESGEKLAQSEKFYGELDAVVKELNMTHKKDAQDLLAAEESIRSLTEHNTQLTGVRKSFEQEIERLKKHNTELGTRLKIQQESNKSLVAKNNSLTTDFGKLESDGEKVIKERLSLMIANDSLSQAKDSLETEVKALKTKLETETAAKDLLQIEVKALRTKLETETAAKDLLQIEVKALRTKFETDKANAAATGNGDRARLTDLQTRVNEFQNRCEAMREAKAKQEEELNRARDELKTVRRQLRNIEEDRRDLHDNLSARKRSEQEAIDANNRLRDDNKALRDDRENLRDKVYQLQRDNQVLKGKLNAAQHVSRITTSDQVPGSPKTAATTPTSEKSLGIFQDRPASAAGQKIPVLIGGKASTPMKISISTNSPISDDASRGPKRKIVDDLFPQRPDTQSSKMENSEKRMKLEASRSKSPVLTFKRKGAIYLVEIPHPINQGVLRHALAGCLEAEVVVLRRVFYGSVVAGEERIVVERWVAKFGGDPKFMKHVYVTSGVHATLIPETGGSCMICGDGQHGVWECPYVGYEGQDRPNAKQHEMMTTGPPLGLKFDSLPVKPPPPYRGEERSAPSLFDRISIPNGNEPPRQENVRSITGAELLQQSRTERRAIFCQFSGNYVPDERQFLLNFVTGGPVEWVEIINNEKSSVGFVDFVHFSDAAMFLTNAKSHINNKRKLMNPNPHAPNTSDCTVEFSWSKTAVKPLEEHLAHGIAHDGWTRVLLLRSVPPQLLLEDVCLHAGFGEAHKNVLYWAREFNYSDNGEYPGSRDVEIEFSSVKNAEKAYRALKKEKYPSVEWARELTETGLIN
jgi:chromosome segregation ATPase